MKYLTIAEEELMHYIWQLGEVVISDLLSRFPEPKPNYNTISTVVKILERKGYLSHKFQGKNHLYSTLITKEEYSHLLVSNLISNYFANEKSKLEHYLKLNYVKNSKSYKKLIDSYSQNLNVDKETQTINRERRVKVIEELPEPATLIKASPKKSTSKKTNPKKTTTKRVSPKKVNSKSINNEPNTKEFENVDEVGQSNNKIIVKLKSKKDSSNKDASKKDTSKGVISKKEVKFSKKKKKK